MILKNIIKLRSAAPVASFVRLSLDTVLPPRCPVTQDIVERQGTLSPKAWASLHFLSDPLCKTCGVPLEVDVGKDMECGGCLVTKRQYVKLRSALAYDDASKPLILGFKHGDRTHAVVSFVPWLMQAGRDLIAAADMIVPVPLHRWRLLQRRYNQSGLMAAALGRTAQKNVMHDVLMRTRSTPSQGFLKAGERAQNVRNAFAVRSDVDVSGKNILLIDDVYTTGATVSECAKALKDKGASAVNVLTLARVVRPERL